MAVKTFRKGAMVRYIGADPKLKELYGSSVFTVREKWGNNIVCNFPYRIVNGKTLRTEYSAPYADFEIVNKEV